MLSGATGQLYGSAHTWRLNKGWELNLDTPGILQLKYMKDLFVTRKWYDLIPDQNHTVMTSGYSAFSCFLGMASTRFGKNQDLMARVFNRISACDDTKFRLHSLQHVRSGRSNPGWILSGGLHADHPYDHRRHVKTRKPSDSPLVRPHEWQIHRREGLPVRERGEQAVYAFRSQQIW